MFKHFIRISTLIGCLVILTFAATPASAQSSTVSWIIPSSQAIDCSAHINCFNNKRTVQLALSSANNLSQIELEARPAGTAIWKNVHLDNSLSGQAIPNYTVTIDFAQKLGTSNVDFELRAILTDGNATRTTSSLVNMRMDSKLPSISAIPDQSVVKFSNNPLQIIQAFMLQEPTGSGNPGSGLQRMYFRIYRNIDSQTGQHPLASGIEGYLANLPTVAQQQLTAAFNWSNPLPDGYYWTEYRLEDHSITSEDNSGNATQFNMSFANCPQSNNGSVCSHLSGQSFESHYFPFVIDTQPPLLTDLKFNGASAPASVTGPVTITLQLADNFSWIKTASIFVNNVETVIPVSGMNKTIQPSVLIPASSFTNGNNTIKICGSDFAGNSMCSQTNINADNPTAPLITVSWVATKNNLTASFSSSVSPSGTSISSYLWNFGNGSTSTVANPVYTYPTAGNYNVILTVTPVGGMPVSYSATVSVSAPAPTPPSNNNNNGTTPRNANSGGNNAGNNNGGYAVVLTGTRNNNPQVAGASTTVKKDDSFYFLDPSPIITYINDPITPRLYISKDLTFQNYLWQYGNRKESTTTEPTHTYSYKEPGIYTLTLTARDSSGVEHIATLVVEVKDRPVSDKATVISQNSTPARINLQGLIDFARNYPYFCCSFLLIFVVLLLLLLRRRKQQQEEAPEERRPLIADRIKLPTS
jgi:PKD repeat protein